MKLKKYLRIWLKTTFLSIQTHLMTRGASVLYILGKLIRFSFFLLSLLVVLGKERSLAGFSFHQLANFFLVFNLLDILGQLFFRGIYWFRSEVVSGHFDLTLVKPASPLFQVLTVHTDILDLPLLAVIIWLLIRQNLGLPFIRLVLFLFLILAGFLLVTSVHILAVAIGVMTTEVDHLIGIYRDLSLLARFPVDIYPGSIRFLLTFVLPVAIIFTLPAKALMGLLTWPLVIYALFISFLFFILSLRLWRFCLTKYSSASS